MSNFFILGAADPEMAAIESLLTASGQRFGHASLAGVRVHPGNAYKADGVLFFDGSAQAADDTLVFVECDLIRIPSCWTPCESCGDHPDQTFAGLGFHDMGSPGGMGMCGDHHRWRQPVIVRVDHHRPGDPGYGLPPERFLEGSSIGQVFRLLATAGNLPWESIGSSLPVGEWGKDPFSGLPAVITESHGSPRGDGDDSNGQGCIVPAALLLVAAADHCLEAAYRGKCPGVDPDALMQWRAHSRAEFQKRPVADVLADIGVARERLRDASWEYHENEDQTGLVRGVQCEYADLREESIPELPEAAAREGIPFLSSVTDRDGRKKVVLMASPPDLISRFMAGKIIPYLVDYYGDPARGFAGGYVI